MRIYMNIKKNIVLKNKYIEEEERERIEIVHARFLYRVFQSSKFLSIVH